MPGSYKCVCQSGYNSKGHYQGENLIETHECTKEVVDSTPNYYDWIAIIGPIVLVLLLIIIFSGIIIGVCIMKRRQPSEPAPTENQNKTKEEIPPIVTRLQPLVFPEIVDKFSDLPGFAMDQPELSLMTRGQAESALAPSHQMEKIWVPSGPFPSGSSIWCTNEEFNKANRSGAQAYGGWQSGSARGGGLRGNEMDDVTRKGSFDAQFLHLMGRKYSRANPDNFQAHSGETENKYVDNKEDINIIGNPSLTLNGAK